MAASFSERFSKQIAAARPQAQKLRGSVGRYIPIITWLPGYRRDSLRYDLIAGITGWGVMTPSAMAYGQMAGGPAQIGLYAAFAGLLGYAIFGTSRHLKVTASSTMAIMSAAVVGSLAMTEDVSRYLALTAGLAMVVGIMLLLAGFARLGFISDFLSKAVVTGFVFGLAVNIIIGQVPKLLGISAPAGGFLRQLLGIIFDLGQANVYAMALGLGALALIFALRHFYPRVPAGLVALALGILIVTGFNLVAKGVAVVGAVPTSLPLPSLPGVPLADLPYLITGSVGIVFLAVGESLGAARAYAARHRYEIGADQELVALGAANIGAGLFGGFTVDVSLSSTATAEQAGARTQLSSIVTAALIIVTVILLAPLFSNLPNAVLAAIVITSVISLLDVGELRRFYASNRIDFVLAMVALVGVVSTDVLTGLIIAVFLSLLIILYRASRPYVAVLGKIPGQKAAYDDVARHPDSEPIPDLLIVRLDAPLYFLNANVARSQMMGLIDASQPPKAVLINLGASADLDIASLDMLKTFVIDLEEMGIAVLLAQVRGGVHDRLARSGILHEIGEERIYLSVSAAVDDFKKRQSQMTAQEAI